MAPPGKKPGLMIAVGVGKPRGGGKEMPPPGGADPEESNPHGQKHSREEAHFVPESKHCKNCVHWDPNSGDCEEVDGTFSPEDACITWFKAGSQDDEESEPMPDDESAEGEASSEMGPPE